MEKYLTRAKCPVFTLSLPINASFNPHSPYASGTIITPITEKKNIKFLQLKSHAPSPTVFIGATGKSPGCVPTPSSIKVTQR